MPELKQKIARRIRQARNEKGWTIDETSRQLGITISRFSNWEQAIRTPKHEQIVQLANLFGKNPAWIAGYIDNQGETANSLDYVTASLQYLPTNKGEVNLVEQVSNSTAFKIDYLKERGLTENKVSLVKLIDDSMSPELDEGDEVLIDQTVKTPKTNDLFALLVNGQIWVRRIRPELDGSFTICAGDSNRWPDQTVADTEALAKIDIVGRVCRIMRDV
ncbi:XRE family transcriptional regulator [Vibrio parahaemolyticus]|uniref:XRE family transcriptional regulator n=1 Tax=Vibrio parahaemolyticus TaxID=670 RepID=UPI0004E63855|nr:LexA family transcriptional regulator [Vibrio parahaemolyticus]KFE94904.1 hypothetical protein HB39_12435 [Vibrio parahaemolyticus]MBX5338955.1 helix-turn-helix domain-containing protein [Vibrio parahaemolyticus]HAS3046015.1 helix-turn-helix domain-containing protein [Vibrio parahaemolyticus]HAS3062080.1 helix-turn-helix domain-containing protein [Vibrio parahaemolyticus]